MLLQVVPAERAVKLLSARFGEQSMESSRSIVVVDEVDRLQNRSQSVLYHIFDWASRPNGPIVIAISNTMDLPERVLDRRVTSRLGLTRIAFQPYTMDQLEQILAGRVQEMAVFKEDAVQLVARKVASLSGDARRALDICKLAAELAESAGLAMVDTETVARAFLSMFSCPKIEAIR